MPPNRQAGSITYGQKNDKQLIDSRQRGLITILPREGAPQARYLLPPSLDPVLVYEVILNTPEIHPFAYIQGDPDHVGHHGKGTAEKSP